MLRWLAKGWRGEWDLADLGYFLSGLLSIGVALLIGGVCFALGYLVR